MKNRPDIDGLRAVAVLPVLFFHADIGCTGGFVGVDIFFVISGYLISSLILRDLDAGKFSIVNFWERRVRRILPALAVVVISCLVAGWFLLFPKDYQALGQSALAQALLSSNIYFWRQSGYFEQSADVKPLLHTWSLAVEEQFYLFFPFLLIAINRFFRKSLVQVILIIGAASFILSVYGTYKHPSATFYLLPARAWELLIGAFLAARPAKFSPVRWLAELLSWGGLCCILYAVFFYNSQTRFPGAAALLPCMGAALIIWANAQALTTLGQLLATRPIVFVGLISYSLYLWHWPILVFVKYRVLEEITLSQRLQLLALSVVLAALSWKFVETPFRQRRVFNSRMRIFTLAGVTTAIVISTGFAIDKLQGLPSRVPPAVVRYAAATFDTKFHANITLNNALQGNFVELGVGDKNQPIRLLVWGDSHAMMMMPLLDVLCREYSVRGVGAAHTSTAPLVGYVSHGTYSSNENSTSINNAIVDFIIKQHIPDVIIVAAWNAYDDGTNQGTDTICRDLKITIDAFKGTGTKIWVMRSVPAQKWNVPKALATTVCYGGNIEELGPTLSEILKSYDSRRQDAILNGLHGSAVTILDPTMFFVDQKGRCRLTEGGEALYCDNNHLTVQGAMMLRPLFEPIFKGVKQMQVSTTQADRLGLAEHP